MFRCQTPTLVPHASLFEENRPEWACLTNRDRVSLGHVDHIDPDLSSLDSNFNTKLNSLEITRSVRIRPQKHIIAVELITLDDSVEITALKISIKLQKAVLLI